MRPYHPGDLRKAIRLGVGGVYAIGWRLLARRLINRSLSSDA